MIFSFFWNKDGVLIAFFSTLRSCLQKNHNKIDERAWQTPKKVVNDLNEATERLGKITKAGDVILFENDLPDNYNE